MARKRIACLSCLCLLLAGPSCAVGPGTPLLDAVRTRPGQADTSVRPPEGYGSRLSAGESAGLINPEEREATEAYLKSLAGE